MENGKPVIRILIAEDHPIYLDLLHRLLNSEDGFEVITKVSDDGDAVNLARELQPDVLVLGHTIQSIPSWKHLPAETRISGREMRLVILCTASNHLGEMLQSGARGIV